MRRYSLRSSLLILATLCVLPAAAINAWLLYSNFELSRHQAEQSTMLVARQVTADLNSELSAIESALKVLGAVDGVGSEMKWSCNGYCGKKQPMVVSMGGPALRTRAHLGGE